MSIPGAEALNRRTLAALSLVGRGDIIHIEFAGVLTDGEYLEVHQLHSVTDISQDLLLELSLQRNRQGLPVSTFSQRVIITPF